MITTIFPTDLAYEDRAKKTTKALADLLAIAGVKYLVLGTGETCTGELGAPGRQ